MMKAIKNFMDKPITWGASFKWTGFVLGLYAAVIGACVAYEKWMLTRTIRPSSSGRD